MITSLIRLHNGDGQGHGLMIKRQIDGESTATRSLITTDASERCVYMEDRQT